MKKEYKMPEILGELLTENNMTQTKLANEMNLSPYAVHKWLAFKCMPSLFTLMAIAERFNVTLDYLVYGEKK